MKSSNETLIGALKILSNEIYSEDGVASACIMEGASRIEELVKENIDLTCKVRELEMHLDNLRAAIMR